MFQIHIKQDESSDSVGLVKQDESHDSIGSGVGTAAGVSVSAAAASPSFISGPGSLPADSIRFFSGNPLVEVTRGILHLYRTTRTNNVGGSLGDGDGWKRAWHRRQRSRHGRDQEREQSENVQDEGETDSLLPPAEARGTLLCILGVPSYMCVADLVQFTAVYQEKMEQMRIVRGTTPGKYMVLINFREQKDADEFYVEFNGKKFSSIEEEEVILVFVSECTSDDTKLNLNLNPNRNSNSKVGASAEEEKEKEVHEAEAGKIELPTCPVCLERLDSNASGIMTILCNHSFHSGCLARWSDNTCPVCRHCQAPELQSSNCQVCGTTEALWICVVCGFLGCGRYKGEHAHKHFQETGHTFSLELETQRVWDYAGDNYVHRLVQNAVDGKVVELPEPSDVNETERDPEDRNDIDEAVLHDKIDSIALEYQYLVTSQLDSQRSYYEGLLADKAKEAAREAKAVQDEVETLKKDLVLVRSKLDESEKKRVSAERKIQRNDSDMQEVKKELEFHKDLVSSLTSCQDEWREQMKKQGIEHEEVIDKLKQRIKTLEEDLHDIMMALEGERIISENPDLAQGDLVIKPNPNVSEKEKEKGSTSSSARRKNRKGKGRR